MNETILLPEMVHAGVEAWREAEIQEFDVVQSVVAIYLAMAAVKAIAEMRRPQESIH